MILSSVKVFVPMAKVPTDHLILDLGFHFRQVLTRLVRNRSDVEHRLDEALRAGVREDVINLATFRVMGIDVL